jgi:hypothetical protein
MCRYVRPDRGSARRSGATFCTATTSAASAGMALFVRAPARAALGQRRQPSRRDDAPVKQLLVHADVPAERDLTARLTFDSVKGQRRLVSLTIMPKDPARPRPITTEALRSLPLGRIQRELDEMVTRKTPLDRRTRRLTEGSRDFQRPGRRGRSEAEYVRCRCGLRQSPGESGSRRGNQETASAESSTNSACGLKMTRGSSLPNPRLGQAERAQRVSLRGCQVEHVDPAIRDHRLIGIGTATGTTAVSTPLMVG